MTAVVIASIVGYLVIAGAVSQVWRDDFELQFALGILWPIALPFAVGIWLVLKATGRTKIPTAKTVKR